MQAHVQGEFKASNKTKETNLDQDQIDEQLLERTYQEMFSVDYSFPNLFTVEMSFTLLDMKILERIVQDKTYDFSNVCEDQRL